MANVLTSTNVQLTATNATTMPNASTNMADINVNVKKDSLATGGRAKMWMNARTEASAKASLNVTIQSAATPADAPLATLCEIKMVSAKMLTNANSVPMIATQTADVSIR